MPLSFELLLASSYTDKIDKHHNKPPFQGIVFAYKGTKEALMSMVEPALHSIHSLPKSMHRIPGAGVALPAALALFAVNLTHNEDNSSRLSDAATYTLVGIGTELGELSLITKLAKLPKNIVAIGLLLSEVAESCEAYLWQNARERQLRIDSGDFHVIYGNDQPGGEAYDAAVMCSLLAAPAKIGHVVEEGIVELGEVLSVVIANALLTGHVVAAKDSKYKASSTNTTEWSEAQEKILGKALIAPRQEEVGFFASKTAKQSFETTFREQFLSKKKSEHEDHVMQQFQQFSSEALLRTQALTMESPSLAPLKASLDHTLRELHSSVSQVNKMVDGFVISPSTKQPESSPSAPPFTSLDNLLKELHDRRVANEPSYECQISKIANVAHQPYPSFNKAPGETRSHHILSQGDFSTEVPKMPSPYSSGSMGQSFFAGHVESTNRIYRDFQTTVSEIKSRVSFM